MKPHSSKNGDKHSQKSAKLSLRVSVEAYRRLFVTSVMAGETASSIVEGLILDGLKRFSLPADLHERASKRQSTQSENLPPSVQSQTEISGQAA